MSLLKQIEDKGAVLEWSPIVEHANLVALGTKESASAGGFDDLGGELELHRLDFADSENPNSTLLGKAAANARFSSIAWSQMAINSQEFQYGLVAGGMDDGSIHVWDPSKLASGDPDASLLASMEQHQGAVSGLHFNPHKESSHLLASGGSDAEVFVTSLEHPDSPSVFVPAPPPNNAKHTADITKVAWNTQVAHILASAAQNGTCYIWDLRQKRAWCELRDPSGGAVSDVAWNPDQGLHLVTASGDDKNPVIKLWDLRSSTSLPLATLQGHREGILSVSWCPADPSLLLSCGKDNRTIMWDLFHLQPVYDLPSSMGVSEAVDRGSSDETMFGGSRASSANQRRHHVAWSPCIPAVISASTFDRRVQFYSMSGAKSNLGRAPKWLRRPVGASFGFGGKLVSFDSMNIQATGSAGSGATGSGSKQSGGCARVRIYQVAENSDLVEASDIFHDAMSRGEFKQYCERKTTAPDVSANDKQVWSLMNVICFGSNAREELLTHLGFDSATITAAAQKYVSQLNGAPTNTPPEAGSSVKLEPDTTNSPLPSSPSNAELDATAFASIPVDTTSATPPAPPTASENNKVTNTTLQSPTPNEVPTLPEDVAKTAALWSAIKAGKAAEPTIRRAIIVGNFEAAVECCLEAGLMAEALLLAQCGEQSLRVRTQAAFFEKRRHEHPFLNVLHAVIRNELMNYVLACDLPRWQETLALLSTYGKSEDFPSLCEALAARLENEAGDLNASVLCYMCAANVPRTVGFWTAELNAANELLGHTDTVALQNYIEKVVVFTKANGGDLGPECAAYFSKYAELLANQGRHNVAITYLKGLNEAENILIDRLYHAGEKAAGTRPPAFPFEKVNVEVTTSPNTGTTLTPASTTAGSVSTTPVRGTGLSRSNSGPKTNTAAHSAAHAAATAANAAIASPVAATNGTATSNANVVGAGTNITTNNTINANAPRNSTSLPPGWLQMLDPASNHPYYVNQATGQSQWEPPAPVPVPAPTPTPAVAASSTVAAVTTASSTPSQQSTISNSANVTASITTKVAGQPSVQPTGHSASVSTPTVAQTSAVSTATSANTSVANADLPPSLVQLGNIIDQLSATVVAPMEKKQISMIRASYTNLCERAQIANDISPEVMQKVSLLTDSLANRNFPGATKIQTDLANTVWSQHKEWIKGLKILIQLASKK